MSFRRACFSSLHLIVPPAAVDQRDAIVLPSLAGSGWGLPGTPHTLKGGPGRWVLRADVLLVAARTGMFRASSPHASTRRRQCWGRGDGNLVCQTPAD